MTLPQNGHCSYNRQQLAPDSHSKELCQALSLIEAELMDGLRHGHFEYSLRGEIGSGGKRHLIVSAGKSHRFYIPESELPR